MDGKPYARAQRIKMPVEHDRRRKLSDKDRADLIALKGKLSQRKAASQFGVSRRLVTFLWDAKKLARNSEKFKERRLDGRYKMSKYETRDSWNARQREIKARKYKLFMKK